MEKLNKEEFEFKDTEKKTFTCLHGEHCC